MNNTREFQETETLETSSAEDTMEAGKKFVRQLTEGDVVGLKGELGAGKTVFVKGMASGLNVKDANTRVTSPTYTLQNIYEGDSSLVHCDAYRLDNSSELRKLGWVDQFAGALTAIEWYNHLQPDIDPFLTHTVHIQVTGKESRTIEINTLKNHTS